MITVQPGVSPPQLRTTSTVEKLKGYSPKRRITISRSQSEI